MRLAPAIFDNSNSTHREVFMALMRTLLTLMLVLLAFPSRAAAQTAGTPTSSPEGESVSKQKRDAQEELEKKALAMLDDTIGDARSLRTLENRVRVLASAAELLWPRDEKRARAIFAEVMEQIGQASAKPERNIERRRTAYWSSFEMREEVLIAVARRDPEFALELLHASRRPPIESGPEGTRAFDADLMLEQRLAARVAAADPKRAARMAEESLSRGVSFELVSAIRQIHARDAEAASSLAHKVVARLKSEDFNDNPLTPHVADALLGMHANPRTYLLTGGDAEAPPPPAPKTKFALDAQSYKDLLEMVVAYSLKAPVRHIPYSLQMLMPEIEKLWPQRAALLRKRYSEYEKTLDPEAQRWSEYGPLLDRESPEGIVEAAAKAPREMRNTFYSRAAFKALEKGDAARARQIVSEHVRDSSERAQLLSLIDRTAVIRLLDSGKFEEARQLVSRIRSKEERAVALSHLALIAAAKKERKLAAQLLDEARGLAGERIRSPQQLNVHLQLARAYALVEPARGFEIVEAVVDRANEMIAAADTLDGFLGGPEIFRDGELIMGRRSGVPSLDMILGQYGKQLAALARADFDRMRSAAARFQRPEVRTMARLLIAQGLLSDRQWTDPSAAELLGGAMALGNAQ